MLKPSSNITLRCFFKCHADICCTSVVVYSTDMCAVVLSMFMLLHQQISTRADLYLAKMEVYVTT